MTNADNHLDRLGEALHAAARAELDADSAAASTTAPLWRRRGPRLALSGAVAIAAAATALIVSAGGDSTSSAYAVDTKPGGGMTIKIFSLGEPEGVERALEDAGIASQVSYLEPGMTCREPHYEPSIATHRTLQEDQPQPQPWAGFEYVSADAPLTIAVGDYRQRREMDEEIREAARRGDLSEVDWPNFVIDPSGFRPDQTLIVSSSPTPVDYEKPTPPEAAGERRVEIDDAGQGRIATVGHVRVAEGEVDPCEPVPAKQMLAPVRAPKGGWDFSDVKYAGWGFGFGPLAR